MPLSADTSVQPERALSYFTGGPLGLAKLWLSHDATETGDWAWVDWPDFSTRQRKKITTKYGSEGTPYDSISGTGQKGPMQLVVRNCPAILYNALRELADSALRCVLHIVHPIVGTKDLDVKVKAVQAPNDQAFRSTDPVGPVTIALSVHGVAA